MVYNDRLGITVRSGLAGTGAHLRAHAEHLWTELRRLRADIDDVLLGWRGTTKSYFDGLKEEWDYAADGLFNQVLGEVAQAMDYNWRNYQTAEEDNGRAWRMGH
jgi:WXG100 family type VII secretion target